MLVACEKAGIMKGTGIDTSNQAIQWTSLAGGLENTAGNSGYYMVVSDPLFSRDSRRRAITATTNSSSVVVRTKLA